MRTAVLALLLPVALIGCVGEIDSSDWAVDPMDYGMSARKYIEAESLHFMTGIAARNGINEFFHFTNKANAADKWVVSPNNDTIYSMAAVDITDGFTLTLPDTGDRFISTQIVTSEHMSHQFYGGGTHEFAKGDIKGSHVAVGIRVGTDGTDEDIKYIVEVLQPQMNIEAGSAAPVPAYDLKKMESVRAAVMPEYDKLPDTFGQMTDDASKVKDWEKFAYVTAGAWGLSADEYAMYAPYAKKGVKGGDCYAATYAVPDVSEFFSITVYGQDKYLMADEHNIVNSGNVNLNHDGTFTVRFGGMECAGGAKNFLYAPSDDWGFLMRAYKPNVEAFRNYQMPEIEPVPETGAGADPIIVDDENFVHAETVKYFTTQQSEAPINTFKHERLAIDKGNQTIIRSNTDLLYSTAIVDVSQGAVFTLPEGETFQIMQLIDENHRMLETVYRGKTVTLIKDDLTSGSYIYILMRTAVTEGVEHANELQDAAIIDAKSAIPYVGVKYDTESLDAIRGGYEKHVNSIKPELSFTSAANHVDDFQYRLGAAVGWAGLPVQDAAYTSRAGTGSAECASINFSVPPLNYDEGGYWSITAYGATGWIETEKPAVNSTNAVSNEDNTITVHFNCEGVDNNIETAEEWNFAVRLYRPDVSTITDFTANFPSPETK